jgi:chemotaxis protein CheX
MNDELPFNVEKLDGLIIVSLPGTLDYQSCKLFDVQVEQIAHGVHVMIDCECQMEIPKDWLRSLLRIQLTLKKERKSMRLIRVGPVLMNYLKKEGIDTTFKFCKDLREAKVEVGLVAKRTLDIEFINPFLTAAMHVLKVQAQIDARAGQVQIKKATDMIYGDVSGVIGIVSDSFHGSVVITFPEATFLKIVSSMLGETFTEISKDILDGAGELTNMIFGQAKIVLNEKGYGIQTAIPSVISGKNHSLSAMTKGPVVVVPFESQAGNFYVEICLNA